MAMEHTAMRPIERRRAPSKLGAVRRSASGSSTPPGAVLAALTDEGLSADGEKPVGWATEAESMPPAACKSPRTSRQATDSPVDIAVSTRLEVTPREEVPSAQTSVEFDLEHDGDEWLDRELAIEAEKRANARRARRAKRAKGPETPDSAPSAATQIVNRAISHFMGGDDAVSPLKSPSSAFKQETNSILDKGLEAINNVSRLMEGFAITLDNVIEKAFEDWGASSIIKPTEQVSSEQPLKKAVEDADASQAFEKDASWRDAADDEPSTTGNDENEEPEEEETDKWRLQALKLRKELAQLKKKQQQLQSIEAQEERLRRERVELNSTPQSLHDSHSVVDQEAVEQITEQLQVLLAEKSKLAQDNARLVRENTGLQELLEFTMSQQAGDADDGGLEPVEEYAVELIEQ